MIEYKQPAIVEEIRRRIRCGIYTGQLPTTAELAEEFGVNIKTMSKAVSQLVDARILERRRRCGTRVISGMISRPEEELIEVIFEGSTSLFTHPFWGEIWSAIVSELSLAGFRSVLNMLEADSQTGLLHLENFTMCPSAGKIILGIAEQHLLERVRSSGVPFVVAGDLIGAGDIPQITFDFSAGIREAVDFLYAQGCRRIGFIGQTHSFVDTAQVHKYNSYLKAVQHYCQIDPLLVEHVRPLAELGRPAIINILERSAPDALIAAYDHQLPGILEVLREREITLPVIGCDGLKSADLPSDRHTIKAPLHECGVTAAKALITAIRKKTRVQSKSLKAEFY
jgi:DNA-binding LacI/PurR family transcriptional regulator